MVYVPSQTPYVQTLEDLRAWCQTEFARVSSMTQEEKTIALRPSAVAPTAPRDGDINYADGTHWDPGHGVGPYYYGGGAWHKLGGDVSQYFYHGRDWNIVNDAFATDQRSKIQQMIDDVSNSTGGICFLPYGEIGTTRLTARSGVALKGMGMMHDWKNIGLVPTDYKAGSHLKLLSPSSGGELFELGAIGDAQTVLNWSMADLTLNANAGTINASANKILNMRSGSDCAFENIGMRNFGYGFFGAPTSATSVAAATTANITLSGLQTIDNYTPAVDLKILVKNQTNPAQNGVYLMKVGAWVRDTTWDQSAEFFKGKLVYVTGQYTTIPNSTQIGHIYQVQDAATYVVGTTPVNFIRFKHSMASHYWRRIRYNNCWTAFLFYGNGGDFGPPTYSGGGVAMSNCLGEDVKGWNAYRAAFDYAQWCDNNRFRGSWLQVPSGAYGIMVNTAAPTLENGCSNITQTDAIIGLEAGALGDIFLGNTHGTDFVFTGGTTGTSFLNYNNGTRMAYSHQGTPFTEIFNMDIVAAGTFAAAAGTGFVEPSQAWVIHWNSREWLGTKIANYTAADAAKVLNSYIRKVDLQVIWKPDSTGASVVLWDQVTGGGQFIATSEITSAGWSAVGGPRGNGVYVQTADWTDYFLANWYDIDRLAIIQTHGNGVVGPTLYKLRWRLHLNRPIG